MSLATRCPACHTAFRVVQDQLKVSEGWVRCGRCNEVFNALEGLFDLERDSQPAGLEAAAPGAAAATQPRSGHTAAHEPAAPREAALDGPPHSQAEFLKQRETAEGPDAAAAMPTRPGQGGEADGDVEKEGGDIPQTAYEVLDSRFLDRSTYAPSRLPDPEAEFTDARYDSSFGADAQALDSGMPADIAVDTAPSAKSSRKRKVRSASGSPDGPEFLRRAEREARWSSRPMRLGLVAATVVLSATLAGQVAMHHRDWLAAHHPASQPWLAQVCDWLGCRIGPLRSIDDVTIDSSSLARAGQSSAYRLTVALRNRSTVGVAVPAIDLTLTDTNGELVARRVLAPADFRAVEALPARGELTLSLDLQSPGHRVAGYTVEAFYP